MTHSVPRIMKNRLKMAMAAAEILYSAQKERKLKNKERELGKDIGQKVRVIEHEKEVEVCEIRNTQALFVNWKV